MASGAVAVVLTLACVSAFLALHGWGTRPGDWTPVQGVVGELVGYAGLGSWGLPVLMALLLVLGLGVGGLLGRRAPRVTGTPSVRVAKLVGMAVVGYLAAAVVVVALPVIITGRADGLLFVLGASTFVALFGALALLPLAAVPILVAALLAEARTRPVSLGSPAPAFASRRLLVGLLVLAAGLGTYSVMRYAVREWSVERPDGTRCTVMVNLPKERVRAACGSPQDEGTQIERWDLILRPPIILACGGDIDVYGNHRIDYDCEGRVADVGQVNSLGYMRAGGGYVPRSTPNP